MSSIRQAPQTGIISPPHPPAVGDRVPMSETVRSHRETAPGQLGCGVITVSDTRTLETDQGGQVLVDLLTGAGHQVVARQIVPDDPGTLRYLVGGWTLRPELDAVLLTGGTGLSGRDQTYETIQGLLSRELPGYGELFRMLSYAEIGPAAMLSRTIGGLVGTKVVLTMPGSPAAVRLAMEKLVLPELGHLVREARR